MDKVEGYISRRRRRRRRSHALATSESISRSDTSISLMPASRLLPSPPLLL